jgi:group I intron endonuclease
MKCVYAILNVVDGTMYVGSTIHYKKRMTDHSINLRLNRHANVHLQAAYNHYGQSNFLFLVLEECKEKDLREREQYWIDRIPHKYNIVLNARGGAPMGRVVSEETREKISASQKGKPRKKHTAEAKRKVSEAMKGREFTPEWRAKISEGRKGKNNGTVSEETRQKLRESTTARWARWREERGIR